MLDEYKSHRQKQDVFSTYTCVNTISEFEEWYASHLNLSSKIYYRGVKEAKYKNYTSAQRYCICNNKEDLPATEVYRKIQTLRRANNNLIEKYCASMGFECTDLMLMSIAQHYQTGFSLFLDFSLDINTALFFMCEEVAHADTIDNSIRNYASLYYSPQIGVSFDDIANHISVKTSFSEQNKTNSIFQESSKYALKTLLSLSTFNLLFGNKSIMIENKAYSFKFAHQEFEYSTNVIISNYNIVAQDGCLLFYDNNYRPLEDNLSCVDIHKSLIPYITRCYLKPNNKDYKCLFPEIKTVVSDAFLGVKDATYKII